MHATTPTVVVMGGGPAGLMAAEQARRAGANVDLYDWLGSVGRKILIAGKGGLNLTHSEPKPDFVARYGAARERVAQWLEAFDSTSVRDWAQGLGVSTIIGSSGRVFPSDLKAAPLLRGWVRRLRESGVRMHMQQRCRGRDDSGAWVMQAADGAISLVHADACVLAFGGASWPRLGSDATWTGWLAGLGVALAPFEPSNCGFTRHWSKALIERASGQPIKNVVAWVDSAEGGSTPRRGEMMLTDYGVEGSLVYALSAALRAQLQAQGQARLTLDLAPDRSVEAIRSRLERVRPGQTLSRRIRDAAGLDPAKLALLQECALQLLREGDARAIAGVIKSLPLTLEGMRPIEEAISSAGGVRLDQLDDELMLHGLPGVWCVGEMIDWDAPTGGYLLTACLASGFVAGKAAADFAARAGSANSDAGIAA